MDHLLMQGTTGPGGGADGACRAEETEAQRHAQQLKSHIHRKGKRGKPLTAQAKGRNRTKASVRRRVAHVCGARTNGGPMSDQ